ncbi:hypothetical protein V9T40_013751 [Parthenolecanium corni]|uniref:Uncharacterized protein n=1 Tax=Parthenolecanium corni TaxID=536013 RepID=A0AAN9TBJ8_9HEMI
MLDDRVIWQSSSSVSSSPSRSIAVFRLPAHSLFQGYCRRLLMYRFSFCTPPPPLIPVALAVDGIYQLYADCIGLLQSRTRNHCIGRLIFM